MFTEKSINFGNIIFKNIHIFLTSLQPYLYKLQNAIISVVNLNVILFDFFKYFLLFKIIRTFYLVKSVVCTFLFGKFHFYYKTIMNCFINIKEYDTI